MNAVEQSVQLRRDLKAEVRRRAEWIANDCSTYWRLRLEQPENLKSLAAKGIGGGNFVMALALFSVFNVLSKCYAFLVSPDVFVTEEDGKQVKEAVRELRTDPKYAALLKNPKTNWRPQPNGSCNETDAFRVLVKDLLADQVDLGLPVESSGRIWKGFRNQLAHMAHPDGIVQVCRTEHPSPDAKRTILSSIPKAFLQVGDRWLCNADRLSIDILDVADWLGNRIDQCVYEERLVAMKVWLSSSF